MDGINCTKELLSIILVIRCGSIFRKLGGENALLKYREESESRLKKFIKNVITIVR